MCISFFLPVKSSDERISGTSSSVSLHSSLWLRFWCCLFFRTLPDIYSLRKVTKRPAKKVGYDVRYHSNAAFLKAKHLASAEAKAQRMGLVQNPEAEQQEDTFKFIKVCLFHEANTENQFCTCV